MMIKAPGLVVVFALLVCVASAQVTPLSEYSLDARTGGSLGKWNAVGSATSSIQGVDLTTTMNQRGALWHPTPVPYTDWEMQLDISVKGVGAGFGEGLALWLVEKPGNVGPVFGGPDMFTGLGVFYDSQDHDGLGNNPSIAAHVYDGSHAFDHATDGINHQLAGCIADYRNRDLPVSTKISYSLLRKELLITVDLTGTGVYRRCLIQDDVTLPAKPLYLGISAENMATADLHRILSFRFNMGVGNRMINDQPPQTLEQQMEIAQAQAAASKITGGSVEEVLHEKMDHMIRAASDSAVHARELGEVLREVETNLMHFVKRSLNRIESKLVSGVASPGGSSDASDIRQLLDRMREFEEVSLKSLDKKVDENKRLLQSVQQTVERSSKRVDSQMRTSLDAIQSTVSTSGGSSGLGIWLYIGIFQALFVAVLMMRHYAERKQHYGKIL